MKQNVLLVGGRSKAKSLAQLLIQKGYQVTIINSCLADCEQLAENDKLRNFMSPRWSTICWHCSLKISERY